MLINLNIDTATPLSEVDKDVLKALLGGSSAAAPAAPAAPATAAAAAPKAAPKAARKAAPKAAPKPEPEPEPDPEPEEEDDDILGGGETYTVEQATEKATEVVSNGGTAKVRAALKSVGLKRVGELSDDTASAFMAALVDGEE